jgi:hypothetical protein
MDIKNLLIKNSYNYVLQSDLVTGVVYRIGGAIPVNPIFKSGLTVEDRFVVDDIYALSTGITVHNDVKPIDDGTIDLGTPVKRFRDINTISGTTTYWTATYRVSTPRLNLGTDNLGHPREITADNSIIQNDILSGGIY